MRVDPESGGAELTPARSTRTDLLVADAANRRRLVGEGLRLVREPPRGTAGRITPDVIEHLPYGLIVTAAGGDVIGLNPAAASMFGGGFRNEEARCCALLGCGQPGSPLEEGCITELALRDRRLLPEVRVDFPGRDGAAWVTASPLPDGRRVVIHLRPGMRGDRRRRTQPHWIRGPHLRIRCLGPLVIESEAGTLSGAWTRQRAGQVLGYLLSERDRLVPGEELAEALWPETGPSVLGTVRYFVHVLRDHLEPQRERRRPSTFIQFRSGGYVLNRTAMEIDADTFEKKSKQGLAAAARHEPAAEETLTQAVQAYSGDFLADQPYAEWASAERDRLHTLASSTLRGLIRIHTDAGSGERARILRARLAEMEPLDEGVHRHLILDDLRERRHSEAARRYELLTKRMRREIGRDPGFDLTELASRTING
jgi:DNA-binding SARP family transcriptional activator